MLLTYQRTSRTTLRRAMRNCVGLATLMTVIACGSQSVTSPVDVTGNYILRAINGQELPAAIVRHVGLTIEVVEGQISLAADGSFTALSVVRETPQGGVPVTRQQKSVGRFTVLSDSTLRLTTPATATSSTLEIRGDVLRYLSDLGNVYDWQSVFVIGR